MSKLMARYRAEGEAAFEPGFEPRSRRPHRLLNRVADVVNDRIVNLREQFVADGLDDSTSARRSWLDDHSRYALYVSCHQRITGDIVVDIYSHRRLHTTIAKVPPTIAYQRNPKDDPGNDGARDHYRIRHNRIDNLDIRVVNKTSSELSRHLTLSPHIGECG